MFILWNEMLRYVEGLLMRVPDTNKTPAQPLTHLWERHKEIVRRLVAGDRQKDIADDMKMTYSRMSIICNSPAFKTQLQRLSMGADNNALDIDDRITALSSDAMSLMEDALQDNIMAIAPKDRLGIAKDVLDRAGHGATKKIAVQSTTLTKEDIDEMRSRQATVVNA